MSNDPSAVYGCGHVWFKYVSGEATTVLAAFLNWQEYASKAPAASLINVGQGVVEEEFGGDLDRSPSNDTKICNQYESADFARASSTARDNSMPTAAQDKQHCFAPAAQATPHVIAVSNDSVKSLRRSILLTIFRIQHSEFSKLQSQDHNFVMEMEEPKIVANSRQGQTPGQNRLRDKVLSRPSSHVSRRKTRSAIRWTRS